LVVASIDIGTNTVLLLVATIDPGGIIHTHEYEQRVPRLGKGVDADRNLQPDSMARVSAVLGEYRSLLQRYSPERIIVAGTSAVRDARNKGQFLDLIRREAGFEVEVLSGADEALWTYRGAISGVPGLAQATVLDIGGGSTEITAGDREQIKESCSLDIGSVRLTERFFIHDPPHASEIASASRWVAEALSRPGGFNFRGTTLIGVAGTATSLAILDQGLREFSIRAIMNYVLTVDRVEALLDKLRTMSSSEILRLSAVLKGRNDIILAGTLILREVMAHHGFNSMIVSERGVRYGLAIREWVRSQQPGATA